MPIRPENKNRYPADWRAISDNIRFGRAGGRCECDGRCGARSHHPDTGRCRAVHQSPHPVTRSLVILTTAHLDHQPENCDPTNLMAMCQACHLAYDHDHHAQSRRQSAVIDGQRDLFASAPTAGPEPGEEPEARSPKSVTREFVNDEAPQIDEQVDSGLDDCFHVKCCALSDSDSCRSAHEGGAQ